MKIVTVVGARPQFIKSAPVSKVLRQAGVPEILVHTGQHYDYGMSQVFFDEMQIPPPDINLGVGSGSHAQQTGQMLIKIEEVLIQYLPDWLLVYGDTNSTLAGALAAAKIHIPVAHVEAGLRSYNRQMPEEHNRVLTDHCSQALFTPTQTAVENLHREGIIEGVHLVGDTMYDAVLQFAEIANCSSSILESLRLKPKAYLLATIHRAYNTEAPNSISNIFTAFGAAEEFIILPLHPRTRQVIERHQIHVPENVRLIEPVGYLDMLILEQNARMILTDSGGIQKEAYFFAVPCLTLRPETEWVETVQEGWNILVGTDPGKILEGLQTETPAGNPPRLFGDGRASEKILDHLNAFSNSSMSF